MFSSDILLLEFPFPLEFFVLHSTNREVDEAERKLTVIKAGQSDMQFDKELLPWYDLGIHWVKKASNSSREQCSNCSVSMHQSILC